VSFARDVLQLVIGLVGAGAVIAAAVGATIFIVWVVTLL
jgi:hypothetical protein